MKASNDLPDAIICLHPQYVFTKYNLRFLVKPVHKSILSSSPPHCTVQYNHCILEKSVHNSSLNSSPSQCLVQSLNFGEIGALLNPKLLPKQWCILCNRCILKKLMLNTPIEHSIWFSAFFCSMKQINCTLPL